MPARRRRLNTTAIALTVTVTAFTAALLTGCDPISQNADASSPSSASPAGGTGTGVSTESASGGNAKALSVVNGTAHNGLTISNGTDWVVMNGTRVNFGTLVRDLAWSPNGGKAAFVDGNGDLVVTAPNGTGRTVVARNPGGVTWSHPTWQVAPADKQDDLPAKDNLIFVSGSGSSTVLETVPATAVDGKPKKLPLGGYGGEGVAVPPKAGNTWPNAAGSHGSSVYENVNGDVYIRDDNLRQQGGVLTPGSEPTMSPEDDGHYVFVRSVAGHDHLFLATQENGPKPVIKDLTPHATTDYTEPAISADGTTIAARTPGGIVTLKLDGSTPVKVSTYTGLPAYRG